MKKEICVPVFDPMWTATSFLPSSVTPRTWSLRISAKKATVICVIKNNDDTKKRMTGTIYRKRMTMRCDIISVNLRLVPHPGSWQQVSPARRRWWTGGGNGSSPWAVGTKLKILVINWTCPVLCIL